MEKVKILAVDDEMANLKLLKEILRIEYTLLLAKNGKEALQHAADLPDLILLDVMMPGMDGYEVCKRLKANEATQDIPVIFVTARNQVQDETTGFKVGAVDYITKPIRPAIVRARVKTHIELRRAKQQVENQNIILEKKVNARTKELSESRLEIVHRLVFAAEYKDPETGSHIQRMSHYTALIAREYGWKETDCEMIRLASPMHDIGKIGIPDHILLKPGKLDDEEWHIMKTHTTIGSQILSNSNSPLLQMAQIIAASHHEKWNGGGYPNGLQGKDIPLFGRMTALTDVFDALTTKRPYKEAWSIEKAVEFIKTGQGKHFDPQLVGMFEKILPEFLEIRAEFPEEI